MDSRALTWWHWIHGHVTKEGITKDLEAMKKVGLQGSVLFNVAFYPEGPVNFNSESWWDHVEHAMKESDRLGLKLGAFNCEGWSMSGGPWIEPEESMKRLTWADTVVTGGGKINIDLPTPDHEIVYKDVAVLAFPLSDQDIPIALSKIIEPGAAVNRLFDGDPSTQISFETEEFTVVIDLGQSHNLRRMDLHNLSYDRKNPTYATLSYSIDGTTFNRVPHELPLDLTSISTPVRSLSFKQIEARYLKVSIQTTNNTKGIKIGEITFHRIPKISFWTAKSLHGYRVDHINKVDFAKELLQDSYEELTDSLLTTDKEIINISDRVNENGQLTWEAPKGNWRILRVGYTITNAHNHPTSAYGRGLESDKMNKEATKKQFDAFLGQMIEKSKKTIGKPIDFAQLDSWEANIQNWTDGLEMEFERRRGYTMIPYLPVLAGGYVINSYEESNRFLFDFRKTMAELVAENYWGAMKQMCEKNGVLLLGEGSGSESFLYDPMTYLQHAHVPMGEFWTINDHVRPDNKHAATTANLYNLKIVGSEAFTARELGMWANTPYQFKKLGDEAFAIGINQLVLHTYIHQPHDLAPGFTLKRWGNHFQRLNPWYLHAQGWTDYLARNQYLLRMGKTETDFCYFTGEGVPGYLGRRVELNPLLPGGYDYDGVNLKLLKEMQVEEGKLVHPPSGNDYHLLIFRQTERMTQTLIKEIKRLTTAGATIMVNRPTASLSLVNYPENEENAASLIEEVWGDLDGKTVKEHTYGKGKVIWGRSVQEVLDDLNLLPDFTYKTSEVVELQYIHRKSEDLDIYFIANPEEKDVTLEAIFRVDDKTPELWNANTGSVHALSFFRTNDQRTRVPLMLDPLGSSLIVFSRDASTKSPVEFDPTPSQTVTLKNEWDLTFDSYWREPEPIKMTELKDWTEIDELKYFSGTASYSTTFQLADMPAKRIVLDLGKVKDIAEVELNGEKIANLWKKPYRTDITEAVIAGENKLTIHVTNTAVNRLIGDEQLPRDIQYGIDKRTHKWVLDKFPDWYPHLDQRQSKRESFVTFLYLEKDSPLESAGMLGPVNVQFY